MGLVDRNQRLFRITMVIFLGFLLIVLNLVRMQILKGAYYRSLSEKNRIRVIYLDGPRGNIFDRNAVKLAGSRLRFNCAMIPALARKRIAQSSKILAAILKREPGAIESQCEKKLLSGAYHSVVVFEDITPQEAMSIEERSDQVPGFFIETHPQRVYFFPEAMAHILGYIGPITEAEVEDLEFNGYTRRDWIGRDGIEKMYESYVRGKSGGIQMEADSRGKFLRALGVKEPQEGKDLQLTIDSALQSYVQEILGAHKGAVVVMDLADGGILAMNSAPSFNPNLFASTRGRKEVGRYLTSQENAMVNRAIRGQYPAGSIFKIITALAGLENHTLNSNTAYPCAGFVTIGGNRFNCWNAQGHGLQNLSQAFTHSCNAFFYQTGLRAGADTIHDRAADLGFSKKTGIDLPNEKKGVLPSRSWKMINYREPWYDGDTANFSIGQGYLQVTPIQALIMVAGVAMDGAIIKPHLIEKIAGQRVAERSVKPTNISPGDWKIIKQGLDEVINSDTGTGRLARLPNVRVAGKTGTAQSGQDKTHAWFVGFAPVKNPKIALVVFLENGGRGGVSAATLAGSIFKWLKQASYL